jgi:hypothetical protein
MNEQFFDTREFLDLCRTNKVEPMVTSDHRLVLVCPKYPGKDVESKFKAMIPEEVSWMFAEGLCQTTLIHIKMGLKSIGLDKVLIHNLPNHRVTVDVEAPEGHPLAGSTSPVWDMVASILKKDSFAETFIIRVNGSVVRDSSQYVGSPDVPIDDEGDYMEDYVPEQSKRVPAVPVKDDRFDNERSFLPKDVGTDVKILLETTGSVEEFLKNI